MDRTHLRGYRLIVATRESTYGRRLTPGHCLSDHPSSAHQGQEPALVRRMRSATPCHLSSQGRIGYQLEHVDTRAANTSESDGPHLSLPCPGG